MTEHSGRRPSNREVTDALARMAAYHAKKADHHRGRARLWGAATFALVAAMAWVVFGW